MNLDFGDIPPSASHSEPASGRRRFIDETVAAQVSSRESGNRKAKTREQQKG
jgi:hypothetical protein